MFYFLNSTSCLRNDAQDFAANARSARFAIGHHTSGGGHDGDAQPVHDFRNVTAGLVDSQARTAYALDLLDYWRPE
jgi:hypothetical protein